MNYELQPIPFHQDTIYLVDHDGQPVIPVRPIVENMGLDWKTQHRKLTTRKERWGVVMMTTPSGGGNQETICIPLLKLTAFLYSIEPEKVRPDLKAKVEMYQNECDQVLWNYWTKGIAVNPRMNVNSGLVPAEKYIEVLEDNRRLMQNEISLLQAPKRRFVSPAEKERIASLSSQGLTCSAIAELTGRKSETVRTVLYRLRKEAK